MKRILPLGIALTCIASLHLSLPAGDKKAAEAKTGLQELNDFIGNWNGTGGPDKPKSDPKEGWKETIRWGWRFKKDDVHLVLEVEKGKHFKNGELRYLPDKKVYQLTAVDAKGEKKVFEGKYEKGYLTLDRVDPKTKETQRLTMNLAGGGVRFLYAYSYKADGRTLFVRDYRVDANKEGESLAAKEKKNECVVTGGLGTMAVSYKGVTYYVCCSGCRDLFHEEPEKIIKEYLAKKKGNK